MSRRHADLPDDDITQALAKDRLGVPAVVFFVMSAAAPLMYVAGVVGTGYAVTGLTGLPVAFFAIGLVLATFSVGYVAMGHYLPHAGAFYAYVSHGLGRISGVGTAWVALLAYNGLQIGLYGMVGVVGQGLLEQYAGLTLPWWIFALAGWAIVGVLGLLRVDVNGTVLAVLLVAEIVVITAFDLTFVTHPAHGLDVSTLSPGVLLQPGAGALLALAVLGFTGFESAVVFSEESRNPRRTVPLATFASIAIIAVLYGLSSWALGVTIGTDKVVQTARDEGANLLFGTAAIHLGSFIPDLGSVLFLTSLMASAISFHNTTARYIFALGRERVLPSTFGSTTTSGAPKMGSLAQTVTAFVVIVLYAVLGLDPLVQLFYTLGTAGGFGAIVLIAWTAIAVPVYFRRNNHAEPVWRTTVFPLLAVVATLGVLMLAVVNFSTLLGVPEDDPLTWAIPMLYVLVGALGCLYGWRLKMARPNVYRAIGLGAKSTSTRVFTPTFASDGEPAAGWFQQ